MLSPEYPIITTLIGSFDSGTSAFAVKLRQKKPIFKGV
jgi:hypothetical protein